MESNQRLEYLFSTLFRYHKLWIYPALAGMFLAIVYVFCIKSSVWTARQSLIVRDDLLGQAYKPGQFTSLESMKSAQETILEVARKPQVIRRALQNLGPVKSGLLFASNAGWPSEETIEDVQGAMFFSAPNGAEFGKTEVVLLNVKSSSRERSRELIEFLLDEIDIKLSEVRVLRLESMESELSHARDAAFLSLQQSARKLRGMESQLGADVSTMNGLNSEQPGDNSLKRELAQIRVEKRAAMAELESAANAQQTLGSARLNPEKMLAASAEFVTTHPSLGQLQASLVTAQQTYANNVGRYQAAHPLVQSSQQAIVAMREQIYLELETLTQANASHVNVLRQRIARLDNDINSELDRLIQLGTQRIDHLTINSEVEKKTELFNLAQAELVEVQALRLATGKINWLTRIDDPQVATRPDGMGKKATVLAAGFLGLVMGLGLVMLVAPPMEEPTQGRPGRREDLQRRAADRLEAPSLDEMLGPTAATAIHSATAATTATVSKGISMAKSAFGKTSEPTATPLASPAIASEHVTGQAGVGNEAALAEPAKVVSATMQNQQSVNVRPVDLIRSADEGSGSASFVQVSPRSDFGPKEV